MFIYICTYTVYLSYSQAVGNYIWTSQIKAIQLKIGEDQNLEFKEASWIIFLQNEFDLFIYVFPDLRRQKKWWLNQRRETRGKKKSKRKRCQKMWRTQSRDKSRGAEWLWFEDWELAVLYDKIRGAFIGIEMEEWRVKFLGKIGKGNYFGRKKERNKKKTREEGKGRRGLIGEENGLGLSFFI